MRNAKQMSNNPLFCSGEENVKVIRNPHAESGSPPKLITSRGSALAHSRQVWSTSVSTFVSYPVYRMTHRTFTWHNLVGGGKDECSTCHMNINNQSIPVTVNNKHKYPRQVIHTLTLLNSNFSCFFVRYCIFVPSFLWIIWLPSTCWKDVLVSFIPRTETDLSSMRLVLLNVGITDNTNVIVDIKAEQRTTFASSLRYNEVVECRVMRDDQVLFDIHKLVDWRQFQFVELAAQLLQTTLQELMYAVTFAHAHLSTVTRAIPVTVRDVNFLRLDLFLFCSPFLSQLLPVISCTTKSSLTIT